MKLVTILLPSYNEAEQIPQTIEEIPKHIPSTYDYRLLFIDDGSSDDTWAILQAAAQEDEHIQALHFSRNFGKEAAVVAGLMEAEGDAVIVMDCDLQHPPRYLPLMLQAWEEGAEVVEGVKESRQDESALARFFANSFYSLFAKVSNVNLKDASDFKLLDRKVVEALKAMPEGSNFFRAQSAWVGYKRQSFEFQVDERTCGETKWSARRLFQLALHAITSFSAKPLLLIPLAGLVMMVGFAILAIHTLVNWFSGRAAGGFTTVILLQLLIGGALLLSLGLIGIYIERIFEATKARPRYIISERVGHSPDSKRQFDA